ncbi:ribosomal-processing cysteine protease Prp [bacterium D16-76]|nr:ribosomal-processing cysteine protease Prp [bacterium D16-76]
MIRVDFYTLPEGGLLGFQMEGHAGMGEAGEDIVCAAVSSAAYLTVNTITDVLAVTPLQLRAREGEMALRIGQRDEPACRVTLAGLKLHLLGLEEQYPESIRVSYMEM